MESKKINQLATELTPALDDLTIIGDPTTGVSKKITLSQMASLFTGTVEEYANLASFPLVGVADTIYIALDTNVLYRWDTGLTSYVELSPNIINSLVFNDANGFDGTIALVGSVATLTITTALTTGSVGFIGASGALLQDNGNFFWDDTNNRFGLGTNAPTTAIDVFGSGIIGRLNGTSTNNAFLGFASAGTNKWSIGNVQSDHRFRIYSEANTAELVSVLQTGEFGIGIANPTTKIHIDGGASALIANLDANVSVAKSLSFRSDNSNRINLEVSGTESGSNAGADFQIKRFSDAGALIDTPLTITRSTGAITLTGALSGTSATFSSTATATAFIPSGATVPTNGMYLSAANTLNFATNSTNKLTLSSTGILGLGITPSAWGSSFQAFQILGGAIFSTSTQNTIFLQNAYNDGVGFKYTTTDNATQYRLQNGDHIWSNAASGTAGAAITFSERMRITSGGNVGIGTTGSDWNTIKPIQIGQAGNFFAGFQGGSAIYMGTAAYYSTGWKYASTGDAANLVDMGSGNFIFSNAVSGTTGNNITWTERMRITSGGRVGIGQTSPGVQLSVAGQSDSWQFGLTTATGTAGALIGSPSANVLAFGDWSGSEKARILPDGQFCMNTTTALTAGWLCVSVNSNNYNAIVLRDTGTTYSAGNYYQVFTNSSNTISGSISHNTITGVNFNTSSDYRLKEDFKNFNGLDILSNIKFYDFKWKGEDKRMHGVIAHELESIIPLAVSGTKDAIDEEANIVAQGVDYSKIVPILGKAIQELKAEIEELKSLINK
jgi:hypothetical protein